MVVPEISSMNFIRRISNELKWYVKVVLLEVSLRNFIPRSVIDKLHSSDVGRDPMEGETGVTGSIIDELYFWDIQGDQREVESGVTRSIIDDLHSSDIQRDQVKVESGATEKITDELHSMRYPRR